MGEHTKTLKEKGGVEHTIIQIWHRPNFYLALYTIFYIMFYWSRQDDENPFLDPVSGVEEEPIREMLWAFHLFF